VLVWCLWQDLPFFLPLPVLTYFAMDVMSKWFGRLESHVPLYMAVTKDMKYWTVSPRPPSTRVPQACSRVGMPGVPVCFSPRGMCLRLRVASCWTWRVTRTITRPSVRRGPSCHAPPPRPWPTP
jgi:hypothetical protein